jgi:hypothetical protein
MNFVYFWLAVLTADYALRNDRLFWRVFAIISAVLFAILSIVEAVKGGAS